MTPLLARALALPAALLLLTAGCAGMSAGGVGAPAAAGGPVRVALVDALTGPLSPFGIAVQNGVEVAIEDLNARGGLLGAHVDLVSADDAQSPDRTARAVRQVLSDRSVRLLVGPSFAGLFLAARPAVAAARVPNCVAAMAADDLMAGAPYTFRTHEPFAADVPALLAYLQKATQQRRVGLVTAGDAPGQAYDQQLADLAGRYGLQYVGAAFTTAAPDQRPLVQTLLQRGADTVVLSDDPATAGRTLLAVKQLNAGGRLRAVGPSGLGTYGFPQQAGDLAAGVVFVSTIQAYLSDVPDARWPPAYHDFVTKVLARFGPAANGVEMRGAPAAADCILEWARAVQAANDFDGTKVVRAWEGLDIPATQSVLGVRERFAADDHDAVPADGVFVYQWVRTGARWGLKQLAGPGT